MTDPERIEATILALTGARGLEASICPSEVARQLKPEAWQSLMTPVRQAAIRLAEAGRVDILRKGKRVPPAPDLPATLRGVIRLRARAPE